MKNLEEKLQSKYQFQEFLISLKEYEDFSSSLRNRIEDSEN